jgi:hypothetical protein
MLNLGPLRRGVARRTRRRMMIVNEMRNASEQLTQNHPKI